MQLTDVVLERISTRNIARPAPDGDGPTVQIPRPVLRSAAADRSEFECTVRAVVIVPTALGHWRADISLRGAFVSQEGSLTARQLRFFVRAGALYVLWPYARVYVSEVAALSGVSGPPLPLIVRQPTVGDVLD